MSVEPTTELPATVERKAHPPLRSMQWLDGIPQSLKSNPADAVMTPEWAAKDMVDWFKPTGRILEPCKGFGAILTQLPDHAEWCEITQGRDFFDWHEKVDWIISNPPYSGFREWMEHSYEVADNIVYLCPLNKFFNAYGQIEACRKHGWVKHIRNYGTGTKLKFPMGNAIGAMHFVKGYFGATTWSFAV